MSAGMSFLEAIGNPLDDDVASAAYATIQLKSDDAKQVAIALGVSADLIPSLTPTVIGVDLQVGQVLARGSPQQAVVAATALFSWHAMAAKAGNDKRLANLRTIANTATLLGSRNVALAQRLAAEMAKCPKPAPADYMFSISIDLVGSTDAKTRVMNLAQGDAVKIDKFNELIYREFCRIEMTFYDTAVSHHAASEAIDPSDFFTVKGIGDEIWILYAVAEQDIPRVGHKLIDAGIQVATQSVSFLATQNEDARFDRNFDYENRSPIKIFIDVVGHASHLGRTRDAGLMEAIPDLLRKFHDKEIARVARRLCLSSYEPIGWSAFHEFRTDYIGHEIDRFFPAAIPGTLTIGASLAQKMGLVFQPVRHGIHVVLTSSNMPLMGGFPADPVHARIRTLEADQLKGIGYDYERIHCSGHDP
jgi:hypothetical protein